MSDPLITVVVPSLDQGDFLEKALESIFEQDLPLEVFVHDGGIDRRLHRRDSTMGIPTGWMAEPTGPRPGRGH